MTEEQLQKFLHLETSLHKKEVRNSREHVDALIADDFVEFGKSGGVFHKQDTLDGLESEQCDLQVDVSDFDAKELASTVTLVTYMASMLDSDKKTIVSTRRSSIWVERNGKWQMVFHQGTKL